MSKFPALAGFSLFVPVFKIRKNNRGVRGRGFLRRGGEGVWSGMF
jgi:hypothetical protein